MSTRSRSSLRPGSSTRLRPSPTSPRSSRGGASVGPRRALARRRTRSALAPPRGGSPAGSGVRRRNTGCTASRTAGVRPASSSAGRTSCQTSRCSASSCRAGAPGCTSPPSLGWGHWSTPSRRRSTSSGPFAFFGHSLGALVAYEVARVLRATGRRQPDRLFASACPAPHLLVIDDAPIHQLPDEELAALINQEYDSLPAEISENPALLQMVLPAHRADFELVETYEYHAGRAVGPPSHRDRGDRGRADRVGAGRLAAAHCRTVGARATARRPLLSSRAAGSAAATS